MSLVNLQTNLKSLRFGKDRPGLGDSGQPYIVTPIPGNNEQIEPNSEDFLLRGGLNGPKDTLTDLERLTKFFNDRSSPDGFSFITKQEALSRIGVRTQASGVLLNEGAYTPLNTLAQAGISIEGGHIPKQGLAPFRGPNTYLNQTTPGIFRENTIIGEEEGGKGNRLVQLTGIKINNSLTWERKDRRINQISKDPNQILAYGGGPDSSLGIGKTRLMIGTDPKGDPLTTGKGNVKLYNGNIGFSTGTFNTKGVLVKNPIPEKNRPYIKFKNHTLDDFRREKLKDADGVSTIMSLAPSYNPAKNRTIDGPEGSRINYVSPGQRGNVIDYSQGKLNSDGSSMGPVDKINALPIYKSSFAIADEIKNDLIKFRIAAIDNNNPLKKEFIHFRAYIDSFSDSYNATWNPQKYMGRGETFYKYDSFMRDINLSFTVAAQSREEIMIMYKKLNFLVSNLAPDYTTSGYMAGPLIQLTVGGWCYELPGFIRNLTLDVPQESPWEIGIPNLDKEEEEFGGIKFRDSDVKEMPMICRVTQMSFTPIHRFNPRKQKNIFTGNTVVENAFGKDKNQTLKTITEYGKERFIQLDDGGGNNAYQNQKADPINIPNPDNSN